MQGEKGVKLQGTMSDSALARALALVRDLRARCPWDRAQTPQTLRPYLVEEVLELDQALKHDDVAALRDEIGDLLFAVVNLARKLAIDPRAALEQANDKFRRRFESVEQLAERRGIEIGRATLAELDRLWDEVKAQSL